MKSHVGPVEATYGRRGYWDLWGSAPKDIIDSTGGRSGPPRLEAEQLWRRTEEEANYSLQGLVSAGLPPSNKSRAGDYSGKRPNMQVTVPEGTWIGG